MQAKEQHHSSTGAARAIICAVLVALTWLIFAQTLGHDFVNYDDRVYVTRNPQINTGLSLSGIARAFTSVHAGNWHPLTTLSHMLDCQLFGLNPAAHHCVNVLLHTAAVVLLYLFLRQLTGSPSRTGSVWASAFVAGVFAIHPLRVESVAWVAERKDVLSALFFMLTLIAYVRYARAPSRGRYVAMSILFAAGLMSKPMLVTVPVVLLLLDYWPLNRLTNKETFKSLLIEKAPLFAMSILSGAVTFVVQEHAPGSIAQLPLLWRLENALVSYVIYFWQTIWPVNLAVFYPHPENHLTFWQITLAALLLVAITALAISLRRARPYLLVGWLWYLVMLLPVIGLVEVGLQGHADRYTYFPQIGLLIAMTWSVVDLANRWPYRRQILATTAFLVISAFTASAWKQTTYWKNSETLWKHALERTPDSDVAQTNMGIILMDQGRIDDALEHLQRALEIRGSTMHRHYDLSLALIHTNFGYALAQKGAIEEAEDHWRKAIEFQPDLAEAHYDLATLLFQRERIDEAIAEFEKVLSIQPNDSEAHTSLGNAFVQQRAIRQAISHYSTALEIAPRSIIPLNNLAWIFSVSPDEALRDGKRAVRLAEEANAYSLENNPVFVRTLAAAYAEAGQFDRAMEVALRAAQLARSQNSADLAREIERDIDLYRAKTPLRDSSLTNATKTP